MKQDRGGEDVDMLFYYMYIVTKHKNTQGLDPKHLQTETSDLEKI